MYLECLLAFLISNPDLSVRNRKPVFHVMHHHARGALDCCGDVVA